MTTSKSIKVPVLEVVAEAFHKLAPVASDVDWKKYSLIANSYEVGFDRNGLHCNAEFDSVGVVLECRTEVEIVTLPPLVRKAILRKVSHEWADNPIAVIRILATAHCEKGNCVPVKWLVLTYSSVEQAEIDGRSGHFLISKTGHVSEPRFR